MGMGSIIQSTPLLQTLKMNFPNAELVFITSASNKKLLEEIHVVDSIWLIRDDGFLSLISSMMKLLRNFFNKRIDIYLDLEVYSYFSTVLTAMSHARKKFGLYRLNDRIRSGVYGELMYYSSRVPVSEVYLQMSRSIPAEKNIEMLYPFPQLHNGVDGLNLHGIQSPFIVVNVNASELRVERRWGTDNFSSLINQLAEKFPDHTFVLSGVKNESSYVNEVIRQIQPTHRHRIIDVSSKLSIKEFMQLLSRCDLMITNDSGPMHLAFALNIRVVALFGPCSPEQYKISEKAVVIYQNVYCSPCVHLFLKPPCGGDNQCMKKISVERVRVTVENLLSGSNTSKEFMSNGHPDFIDTQGRPLGIMRRN